MSQFIRIINYGKLPSDVGGRSLVKNRDDRFLKGNLAKSVIGSLASSTIEIKTILNKEPSVLQLSKVGCF
jgi:hypothetical protein